jgi:alcohol dehydrogenase (cytochrome c)
LNLTYWGIGNPGPDWNGDNRKGDNLYTDSVVALDADSGKLKWYFQFSPHDEFDYDSVQVPVLVDMEWQGRQRKVMLWANRNGYFYVLDRANGQFMLGKPFVKVTWATGLDERGRPMKASTAASSPDGVLIYPGNQGGTNWYNSSFSPVTGLFYIPSWVEYNTTYYKMPAEYHEGRTFGGAAMRQNVMRRGATGTRIEESDGYGAVRAIDPKSGAMKWEFKMSDVTDSGVLTTASNLLFTGGREGYFFALDARNGEMLWKATVGGNVAAGPMTYAVNGKQYVAVPAGSALFIFALKQ